MIEDLLKVKEAIESRDIDKALYLSEKIKDQYWRSYALKWISQELVKSDPKKAREIASSIPITSLRSETLLYLSYELSKMEKFKDAVESAKLIPDSYTKKKALKRISSAIADALKSRNIVEIKLSDLGLDEADIELLKPLPEGVKYENGKFLVDAEIIKTPEEFFNEVVEVGGENGNVKSPEMEELPKENLAPEHISEPFKSSLLEYIALEYLDRGEVDKAVEILERIKVGGPLPRLLFFLGKNHDVTKVVRPIDKVLLAYRLLLLLPEEDSFPMLNLIFEDLKYRNPGKFIRLLKFFSFELLEEGKRLNNSKLIEKSRKLFKEAQRQSSSFSMNLLA
ncbi:hypothetical protein A3L04_10475 [Thermococcus chitonophagus]|nr:hypothetical protein [Thermococcus chitonophagus]ASJ17629.1 hypothetical protein A3L04_10475 [Thermococcus chitonophagus]